MKVLITGASGFVGSHVLDLLRERDVPVSILVRPTSPVTFLARHMTQVTRHEGSLSDVPALQKAVADVTHVIHCAGLTKALRPAQFFQVNEHGTRHLVEAIRTHGSQVQRLIYVSSLAAAGPAIPERPAREDDPPAPVSVYGRSKLAGERVVREQCPVPYVILRPPAVYGPRDRAFLPLFKAARRGWLPLVGNGSQPLSTVYGPDLAKVIVECALSSNSASGIYYVATDEVVTTRDLAERVAATFGVRPRWVRLPQCLVWLICWLNELRAHFWGEAAMLTRMKLPELRAPGWVCDASRLRRELGLNCPTRLEVGLPATKQFYEERRWLFQ